MKSRKINSKIFRKSKAISILVPTEQLNYKQINNSLMPNFIHSLDASNVQFLVKNIKELNSSEFINLYTIHDCFASDYKTMGVIEFLVKYSFIQIYFENDYLNLLHDSILKQINSVTTIFNGEGNIKYINICKNNKIEKLFLPDLPNFE
jgi:DNA-directed RNA polymerase